MTENNAREKIDDDKDSLYVVLRAAEYGCEQKHIKHVAGMCGYSWPQLAESTQHDKGA